MTTSSSTSSALRAVRRFILGPWPLSLTVAWIFASIFVFAPLFRVYGFLPLIPKADSLASRTIVIACVSVLASGCMIAPLFLYRWVRNRVTDSEVRWPEYLLSLAGAAVIAVLLSRSLLRNVPYFQEVLYSPRFVKSAITYFLVFGFINAVLGTFFTRIQKESNSAQAALGTVVAQRRLLLESEERVRGQVAAFLHDRVQTDLMSIALRIRATIGQSPETMNSELTAVISDLERLRSQEVRKASRQLSPNLATVSFDSALRDLSESYRPALDVAINISDAVSRRIAECSDDTRATGLYRICEQGLLNAAIHGLATECTIQVTLTPRDELVLQLSDNGIGVQGETLQPGMGMTVISAWVELLGGQWSLEPSPSGMILTATVPCD